MKPVIILSIVCVATVYTSGRWHTRTRTSGLCFLVRPRSAKSGSGEAGCCLGVPLAAHAGVRRDEISHLQFRRASGMRLDGCLGGIGLASPSLPGHAWRRAVVCCLSPGGTFSWRGLSSGCSFGAIRAGVPIAPRHPPLMFAQGVIAISRPAFAQALEETKQMEIRFKLPSPP